MDGLEERRLRSRLRDVGDKSNDLIHGKKKNSPVCQAQDEELQECGIKQQLLVTFRELGEAGHFLRPAADDTHRAH